MTDIWQPYDSLLLLAASYNLFNIFII